MGKADSELRDKSSGWGSVGKLTARLFQGRVATMKRKKKRGSDRRMRIYRDVRESPDGFSLTFCQTTWEKRWSLSVWGRMEIQTLSKWKPIKLFTFNKTVKRFPVEGSDLIYLSTCRNNNKDVPFSVLHKYKMMLLSVAPVTLKGHKKQNVVMEL